MKKKIALIVFTWLMLFVASLPVCAAKKILPTDLEQPEDYYCEFVGVPGSYKTEITEALKEINRIRLEACENGYENPDNPGTPLTVADYKPVQWSWDLEYTARIRAAEITLYPEHERPGWFDSWYFTSSPNNIGPCAESLAMGTSSMLEGIASWYSEKKYYLSGYQMAAGHYIGMISPEMTYVGMGAFDPDFAARYDGGVVAHFQTREKMDSTWMPVETNIIQLVDVDKRFLRDATIFSLESSTKQDEYSIVKEASFDSALEIGDEIHLCVRKGFYYNGQLYGYVLGMDNISWKSANSNIISVNADGVAKVTGYGKTSIVAVNAEGQQSVMNVNILKKPKKVSIKSAKLVRGNVKVTWKPVKGVTGYQILVGSKSNKKKGYNYVEIKKGAKKKTVTCKNFMFYFYKNIYVWVRSYSKSGDTVKYSAWSKVKKIKR